MAHKQIAPFTGQKAQVAWWLSLLSKLEERAVKASPDAIFPIAMRAAATELLIAQAKETLERAAQLFQDGIDFFQSVDEHVALLRLQDATDKDLEDYLKATGKDEAKYAGNAVCAMQLLCAAVALMPKIQEGVPTYRDLTIG